MRPDSLDCLRLFAQYGPGSGPGFGPGGGYQMMSPLGGGLVMLLGLALVVILAVWLLRRPGSGADDTPLAILKTRYARGEISREEFERMKKDIQG